MARVYSNENFPLPVVQALRQFKHDVLTIQETGHAGLAMTDRALLAFARAEQRVLLTINRKHFIRLHREGIPHAGIIVCTLDVDFAGLAERIHHALEAEKQLAGKLVRINRPNP